MSCSSCKSKNGVENVKWGVLLFGLWVLSTSIYGTVELFKKLISLF